MKPILVLNDKVNSTVIYIQNWKIKVGYFIYNILVVNEMHVTMNKSKAS